MCLILFLETEKVGSNCNASDFYFGDEGFEFQMCTNYPN
jgi:hypothetical protein